MCGENAGHQGAPLKVHQEKSGEGGERAGPVTPLQMKSEKVQAEGRVNTFQCSVNKDTIIGNVFQLSCHGGESKAQKGEQNS